MTVIVDGYKLWAAQSEDGADFVIAAFGGKDLIERAALRGHVVHENQIGWHPLYGELAATTDFFERGSLAERIATAIYQDVAEYP